MTDNVEKTHWSQGGQIFYCDGKAYGVSSKLKTIYIGDEVNIIKALEGKTSTDNPIIDKILYQEIIERGKTRSAATITPRRTVSQNKRHKG